MKNSKIGIIAILFLFVSMSCHAQWQEDQYYGFKINIPASWSKTSHMEGNDKVFDYFSPDQNLAIQLRVFKAGVGLTTETLAKSYESNMLPAGTRKESLSDYTSANGIPGKQGVYFLNYNGIEVAMSNFYTVQKNNAYALTAIIPVNFLQQKSEELKQITKSFIINGFEQTSSTSNSSSNVFFKKYKLNDPYLSSKLDKDMAAGVTPVGLNIIGNDIEVMYLNQDLFKINAWAIDWYANGEAIKNGITAKMQNEGFFPMGISSDNKNLYCLYMKGETNALGWQLVESSQNLQEVAKNCDPYLKDSYLPLGITLHGSMYYVLLVQVKDIVFTNWELKGYTSETAMNNDIKAKITQKKMPFGFLKNSGVINILYVGL